jgi:hypothetical protein
MDRSATAVGSIKDLPCILYDQAEVVFAGKLHSSLYIFHTPGIDTDGGNVPLFTWNSKSSIQITSTDRTVLEHIRFEIGVFVCTRLVGAPDRIAPTALYIGTIARWIVNGIAS